GVEDRRAGPIGAIVCAADDEEIAILIRGILEVHVLPDGDPIALAVGGDSGIGSVAGGSGIVAIEGDREGPVCAVVEAARGEDEGIYGTLGGLCGLGGNGGGLPDCNAVAVVVEGETRHVVVGHVVRARVGVEGNRY